MPKLPVISGAILIKILTKYFDFRILRHKGSHVTLTDDKVFVTIPLHQELAKGTLKSILNDVGISVGKLIEFL